MKFLDRTDELARLEALTSRRGGGFAVVVGRRRIGKTRLLLEWVRRSGGLYVVADESAPDVQRRFVAQALDARFPGFADVAYPDWAALLSRLVREAKASGWRGPVVFDEIPYLVASSPELPSVLQRFVDHDARAAGLTVAIAGSSQRMMQGLVLAADAPLYGRADACLEVGPLPAGFLRDALDVSAGPALVEAYTAWGGVPRYWELAAAVPGSCVERFEHLVLDPLGPLHREPERLLREESPSATEVRPVLDVIGGGAHRVTEIAGRLGRPATSLARPLARLQALGLVRRDVPFGEAERGGRRALYRIDDPFTRAWFRVVAPHRAAITSGTRATRRALVAGLWPALCAEAWEDLCRASVPRAAGAALGREGPWGPCARWWRGESPEWDVVGASADGRRLLLGEVKWRDRPFDARHLADAVDGLRRKPEPPLPARYARWERRRALFVPAVAPGVDLPDDVIVVTARDLV